MTKTLTVHTKRMALLIHLLISGSIGVMFDSKRKITLDGTGQTGTIKIIKSPKFYLKANDYN